MNDPATAGRPSHAEFVGAIARAAGSAFTELFESVDEDFYYCTLTTTGEGLRPAATAWSWQALDRAAAAGDQPEHERQLLKWSYADSPYSLIGEEYLAPLAELFARRPQPRDLDGALAEADYRVGAMEEAMQQLVDDGTFGAGQARRNVLVLVEVMPPDSSNTERAVRLNPAGPLLEAWLDEAAEID